MTRDSSHRPSHSRVEGRRGRSSDSSLRDLDTAVSPEETDAEDSQEPVASRSRRDLRRRQRTKAKAEKMFTRQFEGKGADSSGDGSPRAALYKGKMGASHRKAARMQGSAPRKALSHLPGLPSLPNASEAKEQAAQALNLSSLTPRSLKLITAGLCLVLICVFLYAPAQQYYHAQREYARLTAEYETIEARNDALNVQNDILTSDAGMEDAVRQKYGYVKDGEDMAIVTGLSEDATDTSRDSEHIEANVLSSSVKAPEEWYTPLLDALFGVD